jgi:perosamine synthetase
MTVRKISNDIIKAIKKISNQKILALHEPLFSQLDINQIRNCLKSSNVSSHSNLVNLFEKKLNLFTKSKYSLAIINGTSALQLSLLTLGVGKNDEVILPNYNFIASANAVLYCNAVPVFLDIELETYGLDPQKLEFFINKNCYKRNKKIFNKKTGNNIKVIIVTHVYGNPCKINQIIKICKKYKLRIIEDASEALGSFYKKKHLGTFGDIGVLSFNGNKIITTGGGGAILTNNIKYFKNLKLISNVGKIKNSFWTYKKLGFNFKMPGLNAALGISQLRIIKFIIRKKRELYGKYLKVFKNNENIRVVRPISKNSNYWLISIFIRNISLQFQKKIINNCIKKNINLRPGWKIMTSIQHLKKFQSEECKNSKIAEKSLICLPSSWHIMKN